ncbi:DNA polymerase III subunit beta [Methylobacterium gnaphalii]|uniref:Beta sliding clamp n=1 Tax=Methylobacterium gnaphalii TaxID=1010610 RepID=A0A512JP99_9HYPH|nr:DNA polymerase III subunit beta [Methylobacterium gnaphalii]GEP11790.1 DNA polymerase III subunit beta [Methylobacterium gnaphalii]GJD69467.1 Beta sliding clamp [Methylobacterium gnaphalii]GLS49575.1 DNA polymerase III subunit beta [Methylobacterium gnaphalii]
MPTTNQPDGFALSIERAPLLAALKRTLKAVERRNTIPILSNALLRADGDTLTVTGTDLDIEVTARVPAAVSGGGALTVPLTPLEAIVSKFEANNTVSLNYDEKTGRLVVKSGRSKFQFGTLPASDFPELTGAHHGEPGAFRLTLAGKVLADMISRCAFAISNEETRYYLNGIYTHVVTIDGEPTLRFVATTGHQLARIDSTHAQGLDPLMPGIIIPRKAVAIFGALGADTGDGDVELIVTRSKIRASAGTTSIVSKLIDGTFPDYQRVIPTQFQNEARAPTLALIEALGRVATLSGEKVRGVKLQFSENLLGITLRNHDIESEASDELDIEFEGTPFEIGFNSRYLAEILDHSGSDVTTLHLGADNTAPIVIGDRLAEGLYVLMPLRI